MNNEKIMDKYISILENVLSSSGMQNYLRGEGIALGASTLRAIIDAALAQQSEPETAKAKWNATADEHNQWDELGQDEKDELEAAQVDQRLLDFYNVKTANELIAIQEHHIKRLQEKLAALDGSKDAFLPKFPRG